MKFTSSLKGMRRALRQRLPVVHFPWVPFASGVDAYERPFPIYLNGRLSPRARYGWGEPPHAELYAMFNARRDSYAALLRRTCRVGAGLRTIAATGARPGAPQWNNRFVQGLDAMSLYGFPPLFGSKRYLEIGSGHSTKFVRQSIHDHELATTIVSVDPFPRADVDGICDEVIRAPLESLDLSIVDRLEAHDILMFDGSHRCFQNSDVMVFFLEVLPRLKPGVLVFVHDIFLPYDYRPEWATRWYSEQYMMAVLLLNDRGRRYEVLCPSLFIDFDPGLRAVLESCWTEIGMTIPLPKGATALWLRVRG